MTNQVQTIFICQFPMPFDKIASWTNMYNYLLKKDNPFDYIICPKPNDKTNSDYVYLRDISLIDRIKNKVDNRSLYSNYIEALKALINKDKKYIIHIVDNSGVVLPIHSFLSDNYERKNFYIQYYYQGFNPIYSSVKGQNFIYALNEIFFLTELSYKAFLDYYSDFTPKARVLYNGTDSDKFKIVDNTTKVDLRTQFKIHGKMVFIWCSQDRPKKGLDFILDVWKKLYSKYSDKIVLFVVGVNREIELEGVINVGRVPNHELPKYYQMSDVYLFPSLWKEGFGIVLAEAIKCGCYVIASKQGGIPEVLQFGKLGKLIENPNIMSEWNDAINDIIQSFRSDDELLNYDVDKLYDLDIWVNNIIDYLEEAKGCLLK